MISLLLILLVEFSWPAATGAEYYELCTRPDAQAQWSCGGVGNVLLLQVEPQLNQYYGVRACDWLACGDVQTLTQTGVEVETFPPGKPLHFNAVRSTP